MDLLAQLVEKSLVLTEQRDDEARYRMLETVREYARAGLAESGEAETVSARHRDWYLGLAERAASEMQGPRQGVWLDRLEDELDNLRAAFGWSQNRQDAGGVLLRLATALRRFWFMRGRPAEGRKWLEDALDQDRGASPGVVIKALDGAAHFARQQRDYPRALALAEQGLALARAQGDKEGTALSLDNLGLVAALQGDFHKAIDTCERSLTLWRELGDRWQISTMLRELGAWVSLQGDHGRAIAYHTESLELARQLGDKHRMAFALRGLGDVALLQGDVRRATTCFSEGLTLSRETGNRLMIRISLDGLAAAACAQGRHKRGTCLAAAAEALREALGRHRSAIYQR
jgi:tetratricopeptide (TPR) repeat protein